MYSSIRKESNSTLNDGNKKDNRGKKILSYDYCLTFCRAKHNTGLPKKDLNPFFRNLIKGFHMVWYISFPISLWCAAWNIKNAYPYIIYFINTIVGRFFRIK